MSVCVEQAFPEAAFSQVMHDELYLMCVLGPVWLTMLLHVCKMPSGTKFPCRTSSRKNHLILITGDYYCGCILSGGSVSKPTCIQFHCCPKAVWECCRASMRPSCARVKLCTNYLLCFWYLIEEMWARCYTILSDTVFFLFFLKLILLCNNNGFLCRQERNSASCLLHSSSNWL